MKATIALLMVVALAGLVFSGYLTYMEYSGQPSCEINLGVPPCLMGFVMYLIILVLAVMSRNNNPVTSS